jgi:DNA invertase Pin-like site-specific DNA recombinase
MSQILAYLRTSTDKQDLDGQRLQILDYARKHQLEITDFIAINMSSRRSQQDRRLDELLARLDPGDTLLVTELSRLGRSTGQVISLIDDLLAQAVQVVVIKQNLTLDRHRDDMQSLTMVTMLSLFAEMERMMISQRTREALAASRRARFRPACTTRTASVSSNCSSWACRSDISRHIIWGTARPPVFTTM